MRGGAAGLLQALALLAGLLAAGLALRALPNGVQAYATLLRGEHGAAGQALFVATAAAACAAGLPRQAAAFAGGYAFGALWGGTLAMTAQMLGCAAAFMWARAAGRGWAARRVPARLRGARDLILARPFSATLTLRLLPVGSNLLLNLLAGLSAMRPAPFFAATLIGYVPQTAAAALLGAGAQIGQGAQIGLAAGLFAASGLLGLALLRRSPQAGGPAKV